MDIQKRIKAISELGQLLITTSGSFDSQIEKAHHKNGWFTENNIRSAISAIANNLREEKLNQWINNYKNLKSKIVHRKSIGVIMAGNLPLVGFHDFLCVLMSGHRFLGKLSSDDSLLLPALAEMLIEIEPGFKDYIAFTDNRLTGFDAVIATGSNNSSRYFEYYFGKYPHIIRKNRNSLAILSGNESMQELEELSSDIFLYFGLGCRNVSKLFVAENYSFDGLFKAAEKYSSVINHSKYYNNYIYNKSIYLINKTDHFDIGFFILKQDNALASPVSVVYYEYYSDLSQLKNLIIADREKIQCVVTNIPDLEFKSVSLGHSQFPELWDYADEVDTMRFLLDL